MSFMVILYKLLCMPTGSGWSQCHGSYATRHNDKDTQVNGPHTVMVNSLWDQCYQKYTNVSCNYDANKLIHFM